MKTKNSLTVLLLSTLVFGLLFHNKSLGINLVLYEALVLFWLFYTGQLSLKTPLERLITAAQVVTLGFTVLHHSIWSYFIHFTVSFLLVGVMIAPTLRSLINSLGMALSNVFLSFHELFVKSDAPQSTRVSKGRRRFSRLKYYIIPVVIILLFATLYGLANPAFGNYVDKAIGWIFDGLEAIFESIDLWLFLTLILGFIVSVFILKRGLNLKIQELDNDAKDDKIRVKSISGSRKMTGLKNEYRAGVFLFISLNVLLLLMNIMDVDYVWINFKWEGQYLRQFVHFGTIVLIIVLFLSIILVLYFFRGNLNYYSKNKLLKTLCYIWLGQNVFLAISAGVRNYYYIEYYSLAYKRIAIVFFLILTIYGIYSVFIKIKDTRSTFYVMRKNAVAWTVVLTVSAGFNWDRVIAEYNFSRERSSFVHLNFLANLSDTALPALDQPYDRVKKIYQYQAEIFFTGSSLSSQTYTRLYISPKQYVTTIEWRKQIFKRKWEQKNWLEWNYAEARAYDELVAADAF